MPTTGGGGGAAAGIATGPQLAMVEAQKEVLESQADLNRANAEKARGVDTELAGQQIKSLAQGIEESKAKTKLTEADEVVKRMQAYYEGETMEARVKGTQAEAETAIEFKVKFESNKTATLGSCSTTLALYG